MEALDFLRTTHSLLAFLVSSLVIVWVAKWLINKYVPGINRNITKRITVVITIIILVGCGLCLTQFAAVNEIPRSVIDRSLIDEQANDFKKRNAE